MGPAQKSKELDLDQQVDFLKKIVFFNGFDDHELKQFLQVSKWLRVPKDTFIIKEGTTEQAFYILVKGAVRVEKRTGDDHKPVVLTTLATGDCFGEMAMVTAMKRTADVLSTKECFILRVEPDIVSTSNVFLQLKFYKRFCELLVNRLDLSNQRMAGGGKEKVAEPQKSESAQGERDKKTLASSDTLKLQKPVAKAAQLVIPPMPSKEDRLTASKLQYRVRPENVLPVNPAVAAELTRILALKDESDNTRRFADLVSLDPVLCCRVIQTANSPFYRRAAMVGTLPHAMVIVGIKQVQKVVAEAIESSKNVVAFSGFTTVAQAFWQHGVVVGRVAEMLRDVVRISISADLYLSGLLHDLGMFVVDGICPNLYPQLAAPKPEIKDLFKAEKEYVGVDHGQFGVWLAEGIGLPQPYLDAMRFHHQPEKATTNPVLVALVSLANMFAAMKGACLGEAVVTKEDIQRSFAWVLIQEHHKPFMDVNVMQFIASFSEELDKTWNSITGDILL
ncbi:MAG: HDOD domain-containing protein [Desulfobulbaceae bacterium]|nr:HDOD domain-containing protein [Desulfobulbaceae bacterium]HIJ79266.1 HDOD domain-containing protein [Deltaproteobacteria bacterium]